jgi:hypothetical protein
MNAIYITAYNSPEYCERLMTGLAGVPMPDAPDKILMNHSDPEYIGPYNDLCLKYGWKHRLEENKGATGAKWNVIEHAHANKYEIASQISEDFNVCCNEPKVSWLPASPSFYADALSVLCERVNLTFVHWTFVTLASTVLKLDPNGHPASLRIHKCQSSRLAHVEGDVRLLNWPSTYRVSRMKCLLDEAKIRTSWNNEMMNSQDGGEWILGNVGFGQGGVLMAYPVDHDRNNDQRPKGSRS